MVKKGDKIKVDNGTDGKVTHVLQSKDSRYIICYKDNKRKKHYFLEGDQGYKVV